MNKLSTSLSVLQLSTEVSRAASTPRQFANALQELQWQNQDAGQAEPVDGPEEETGIIGCGMHQSVDDGVHQVAQEPYDECRQNDQDSVKSLLLSTVDPLMDPSHLSRPRADQDKENRDAAEGDSDRGGDEHQEGDDDANSLVYVGTTNSKTEQPNTANADVSDPDSIRLLQSPVGNGINNGQVALAASKHMKHCLSRSNGAEDVVPHGDDDCGVREGAIAVNQDCHNPKDLQKDDVKGENIRVSGLSTGRAMMIQLPEDKDEEWEKQDVGDKKGCEDSLAQHRDLTVDKVLVS